MNNDTPTIFVPRRISRDYIRSNPTYTFIYSTAENVPYYFGQAEIATGLVNAYGVPVRFSLCRSSGYYNDNSFEDTRETIDQWLRDVPLDKGPIIPFPMIGNGASRLKEFAPRLHAYIHSEIKKIAYPHIEYVI